MKLQLIEGQFEAGDALDLITRLIDVKIKFHESKISGDTTEEDIKMREKRIKQLQKSLYELRQELHRNGPAVSLESIIHLTKINHGEPAAV